MRGAQLVKFIPTKLIYAPARGYVNEYAALEAGVPYCLIDSAAYSHRTVDPMATIEYLSDKPPHNDMRTLALLFPGGIGDTICMKGVLQQMQRKFIYHNLRQVYLFSTNDDKHIINDGVFPVYDEGLDLDFLVTVVNYPPRLNLIENMDSVIGFGSIQRESMHQEISNTLAEIIGFEFDGKHAILLPNEGIQNLLSQVIPDNNRKKIALQIYSSSNYRSIPPNYGMFLAMLLDKAGYDVYITGTSTQRVFLSKNGKRVGMPDGIYDFSGMTNGLDELVAFYSLMDGIICPDTATVHIAGCLEKPTIAFFGPTSGEWRTSYYPTVKTVSAPVDCAPCYNIREAPDCGEKWCNAIVDVNPEEVVEMLIEMIS